MSEFTKEQIQYLSIIHFVDCRKVLYQIQAVAEARERKPGLKILSDEEFESLITILDKYVKKLHDIK